MSVSVSVSVLVTMPVSLSMAVSMSMSVSRKSANFSQFVSLRHRETQFVIHDVGRLIHEIRMPKIRENARVQFSGTRPSFSQKRGQN